MKTAIVVIIILLIIGFGAYFIAMNNSTIPSYTVPTSNTTTVSNTSSDVQMSSSSVTQTSASATVSNQTPAPTISAKVNVAIKNFAFNPSPLTVKKGTTVIWTNNDSAPHTVTSDSGTVLNSPTLSTGQTYSFTFNNVGTFNYHCTVHPMMHGTVVVTN